MSSSSIDDVVLFTGRGGSGTRLLSQLAAALGIFIGNQVNRSGDSIEWVQPVYRIAIDAAASPELPAGAQYREELRDTAARVLASAPSRTSTLWGLKLPETMLVLPLFIDAFPKMKIVHLTRHPIPSSLRRTHMTSRLNTAIGAATLPNAYRYSNRSIDSIATDEPYLHNACSWNYQVGRVARYARGSLAPAQYLEVRYEDVCADPASSVSRMRSFLGCDPEGRAGSVAVDASRMGAWEARDARVTDVWSICGEAAELLGYTLEQHGSTADLR